jgi:hypothetical protein
MIFLWFALVSPQGQALVSGHVPWINIIGFTTWWFQHFNPNGLSPVVYFALQVQSSEIHLLV